MNDATRRVIQERVWQLEEAKTYHEDQIRSFEGMVSTHNGYLEKVVSDLNELRQSLDAEAE